MGLNRDYAEMFSALNAHNARFLVVGGYAVIFHTEPRYTKDMDIWVDRDRRNATRVYRALMEFGAPLEGITIDDLATPGMIVQIGVEPVRIDIMTSTGDGDFNNCYQRADQTTFDGIPVRILSIDDLIRSKSSADRPQDRIDIKSLEEAKKDKSQ